MYFAIPCVSYPTQAGLRRGGLIPATAPHVCQQWVIHRNGRICRGRESDSTAKAFTTSCCGWRYIFETIEKLTAEQSVGGEVDDRVSNTYKCYK